MSNSIKILAALCAVAFVGACAPKQPEPVVVQPQQPPQVQPEPSYQKY